MIWSMLKAIIRRYFKVFLAMVAVTALAASVLLGLTSAVRNTWAAFVEFKDRYGYADGTLSTELAPKRYIRALEELDGVKDVDSRIAVNGYMRAGESLSTVLICTYLDSDYYDRYAAGQVEAREDLVNVGLEKRFAQNNGISAGDEITIYLYGQEMPAFVQSVVYTPETVYVNPNPYLLADTTHFGYVFVSDGQMVDMVRQSKKGSLELFWEDAFEGLTRKGALQYANQVLVRCEEGVDRDAVLEACREELSAKTEVLSVTPIEESYSESYMREFKSNFEMLVKVLASVFYGVVLLVTALFLNQLVLYLTPELGVMLSIGFSHRQILGLLSAFALSMSAGGLLAGEVIGRIISDVATRYFAFIYQIPIIGHAATPGLVAAAVLITVAVGQFSVLTAAFRLFRITPKDAMLGSRTETRRTPDCLKALADRLPPDRKLNFCLVMKNPRRVLMSVCSIAASLLLILTAMLFYVSNEAQFVQLFENGRYRFDAHYLCLNEDEEKTCSELLKLDGIERVEKVLYSYVTVGNGDRELQIKLCGLDSGSELLIFPDENGRTERDMVPAEGICLNRDEADELGVTVGDTVSINGHPVPVAALTLEYMHKTSVVPADLLPEITEDITAAYLCRTSNLQALEEYLAAGESVRLVSTKSAIESDLHMRLEPLNMIVVAIVIFGTAISLIVIAMMSRTSLSEQQRLLSVLRVLGFSTEDLSAMWLRQDAAFFIAGSVIGTPLALLLFGRVLDTVNNRSWTFPFIWSRGHVILAFLVIAAAVVAAHFLTVRAVKKWNLAENTRSRE